jgi:hypothetical protein
MLDHAHPNLAIAKDKPQEQDEYAAQFLKSVDDHDFLAQQIALPLPRNNA